jgi:hypothetical protein
MLKTYSYAFTLSVIDYYAYVDDTYNDACIVYI